MTGYHSASYRNAFLARLQAGGKTIYPFTAKSLYLAYYSEQPSPQIEIPEFKHRVAGSYAIGKEDYAQKAPIMISAVNQLTPQGARRWRIAAIKKAAGQRQKQGLTWVRVRRARMPDSLIENTRFSRSDKLSGAIFVGNNKKHGKEGVSKNLACGIPKKCRSIKDQG